MLDALTISKTVLPKKSDWKTSSLNTSLISAFSIFLRVPGLNLEALAWSRMK